MSNIKLFENAFAVDFPPEIAVMVLDRISGLYGTEFAKKYAGDSNEELIERACTCLNGLTPADISRGITRMNSEEFCPSLPRFRSWCEQGGDWWTADMAWAKAMQFESDPQTKLTALTKCSLEEVRHVLIAEGQKAAHYAFKDIYSDYLRRAKAKGMTQEMWVKPKPLKQIDNNDSNRNCVPCPPELAAKIGKSFNRVEGVA